MEKVALVRCLIGVADEQEKQAIIGAAAKLLAKPFVWAGKKALTKTVTVGGKKVTRFAPKKAGKTALYGGLFGIPMAAGAVQAGRQAAVKPAGRYTPQPGMYSPGARFG